MCWISRDKPIRMVADADIVVNKVLAKNYDGSYASPCYRRCLWELGVVYSTFMDYLCEVDVDKYSVSFGFHSCGKIISDDDYWKSVVESDGVVKSETAFLTKYENESVFECIIPKGSAYFVNSSGMYVSEMLKVIRKV